MSFQASHDDIMSLPVCSSDPEAAWRPGGRCERQIGETDN